MSNTDTRSQVEISAKGTEMEDTSAQLWLEAGGSPSVTGQGRNGAQATNGKQWVQNLVKDTLWKGDMGTPGCLVMCEDIPRSPCFMVLFYVTIICLSALIKQEQVISENVHRCF